MVYITGDLHGDFSRFSSPPFILTLICVKVQVLFFSPFCGIIDTALKETISYFTGCVSAFARRQTPNLCGIL